MVTRLNALKAPGAHRLLNMSRAELDEAQKAIRPVVRTYTDHASSVNDIDFHPSASYVASASRDCTINMYDYARPTKKANRKIEDVFSIRSLAFHPSGDFLLVGTDDPPVRIYDTSTLQAYVNTQLDQHHTAAITMARWSPNGHVFATASRDGSIKVWDTVSCQCVRTIRHAHTGASVSSVCFDARGTHLLSSGQDNTARLYDLATGDLVVKYEGGAHSRSRLNAVFSSCGEYVMMPDERSCVINVWQARPSDDGAGQAPLALPSQHQRPVKFIAASPSEQAFVTCSEDTRVRFWHVSDETVSGDSEAR